MKRILGSLISVGAGWAAAGFAIALSLRDGFGNFRDVMPLLLIVAIIIVPVWLLVFLPIYALWPRHSWMTSWWTAAPIGAICGVAIFLIWPVMAWPFVWDALPWPFPLLPGIVGSVSAAVGALTLDWSRRRHSGTVPS